MSIDVPISVTDPIDRAIKRAKLVCFQPFNLGKWFTLGFIAFLVALGEGGSGGGGNFNIPTGGRRTGPSPFPQARVWFDELSQWVMTHLPLAITIGVAAALIVLTIWLLLLWISSRDQFMFIEAIAQNTSEVRASWKRHRQLGNSLFAFRATVFAASTACMLVVAAVAAAFAWQDFQQKTFGTGAQTALILVLLLMFPMGIATGLIGFATNNFVTPIMYATGVTVLTAWGEFWRNVLAGHVGRILLYLLMRIILLMGVGIAAMVIMCATCLIAALPYLGSVATLPLSIFLRAYSLYFIEQFSPGYAVIVEIYEPAMYGFPVIPIDQRPPSQPQ